ncbi:hypothetical protein [Afipia carboxidovorans]|uniref:hypothetical protein n=1 Tax=Afipia carboxidovorans TaxID=40137 RepID=UPI00308648DB|nr:hypothetical protein CRBSH125_09840 [Afipia carboxidovorans]
MPSTAHLRAGAERDSYLASSLAAQGFPAVDLSRSEEMTDRSFPSANPPFPRSDLAQAVIDVLAVLFFFLLAVTFGFAVTAAIFVLLFVGI